jgi:pyrimidine-specific ribonucleoside hydrolase
MHRVFVADGESNPILLMEPQPPPRSLCKSDARAQRETTARVAALAVWEHVGVPRRILMDVDTGTDDALAILYAVRHPDLEVLGISCVAGNVPIDQVVINTCKVLDVARAGDIPVAAGARQPLIERARRTGGSHGVDGLGGIQLPETARQRSPMHAVELLHQLIMASTARVTLVTLAPKTNVALLLTRYPDLATRLEQIIFMGGSGSRGNVTAHAEFNVGQDPEAAQCVIESAVPITMYGLDAFSRVTVSRADADRFRELDHPAIWLAGELLYRRRARQGDENRDYVGLLGDAGAMVLLTNPELFTTREFPVWVDLGDIGRGQTIVDERGTPRNAAGHDPDPWPRIAVVVDLDVAQVAATFVKVIDAYDP